MHEFIARCLLPLIQIVDVAGVDLVFWYNHMIRSKYMLHICQFLVGTVVCA